MTRNPKRTALAAVLIAALLLCSLPGTAALADDAKLQRMMPGQWTYTGYLEKPGEEEQEADLAFLTLEEDGSFFLWCDSPAGGYACSCEGTWAFKLVPENTDQLTLRFTSTDAPQHEGSEWKVECVYEIYAESWVENDTEITWLVFTPLSSTGDSPFIEVYGEDPSLHRERGPNMRIANCNEWVALREAPSKNAKRLAKVPLGAHVLAYPEANPGSDFVYCVYQDQEGYILAQYLEELE